MNVLVLVLLMLVSSASAQNDFDFSDISWTNIINILNEACNWITNDTINQDECFRQLRIVCGNNSFREIMLDASSSFPYSGMLVRTPLDLGTYDECVGLELVQNDTRVIGKHCTSAVIIPTTSLNDSEFFENAYKLSVCLPDKCSAKYLLNLVGMDNVYPLFNDNFCFSKDTVKHLTWDDYLFVYGANFTFILILLLMLYIFRGVLSFISAIMILATVYELYYFYTGKVCPNAVLQAFSIFYNGKKLFKISRGHSTDQINVIHGLRVVSMMWIVIGHCFLTYPLIPVTNKSFFDEFQLSKKSFYISSAYLAVDTFFFISGFLLAYQYLKMKPRPLVVRLREIPTMIIHRYIRITPMVAILYFLNLTLLRRMGDGPLYDNEVYRKPCIDHWWSYFAYLQNYVNYDDICMVHTWYLSADWQLFLLSPIIFIPVAILVKKHLNWVLISLLLSNILFTIIPIVVKFKLESYDNEFEAHTRLNVYFTGFMLGVYMRESNKKIRKLTNLTNLFIWATVLSAMALITVGIKFSQLLELSTKDPSYSTYAILWRGLWSGCLIWVLYACHNGYGGVINWFLTTSLFQVLSRLTYCIYIAHFPVIAYHLSIIRSPITLSQWQGFSDSILVYSITVMISVWATLTFESPFIAIEKLYMSRPKSEIK